MFYRPYKLVSVEGNQHTSRAKKNLEIYGTDIPALVRKEGSKLKKKGNKRNDIFFDNWSCTETKLRGCFSQHTRLHSSQLPMAPRKTQGIFFFLWNTNQMVFFCNLILLKSPKPLVFLYGFTASRALKFGEAMC